MSFICNSNSVKSSKLYILSLCLASISSSTGTQFDTALKAEHSLARGRQPYSNMRLPINDDAIVEDDLELMDTNIFSTAMDEQERKVTPTALPSLGQLQLPISFETSMQSVQQQWGRHRVTEFSWPEVSVSNFECRFNQMFGKSSRPLLLKTGTTIAGVSGYGRDGQPFVVLGADTRATASRMVADKRCQKIHCLARNIWCCGAGTSADLDQVTRQCRYTLALQSLHELESIGNGRKQWETNSNNIPTNSEETTATHSSSVARTCRYLRNVLYDGSGNVGANLILGGVDEDTLVPYIRAIHPHGSMDQLPYAALGSGGLAAMAVIESRFHANITLDEGIQIVKEAILSGIQNDMGSGSQVDLCVITTSPTTSRVISTYQRAVVAEEELSLQSESSISRSVGANDNRHGNSIPGVNGFGNYALAVSTKKILLQSHRKEEEARLKLWDSALE